MPLSSLVRGFRLAMPLGAFLTLATLATVLAAQAQIACTRQIAIGLPAAMPGMDMGSMPMAGGMLSICPLVLVLSIAAVALTFNAAAVLLLDRKNETVKPLARYVLRQPFVRSCICLLTLGGGAVATMMSIDGNVPQGPSGWLILGAIIVASAIAATGLAIALSRCIVAIAQRITAVIERAICVGRLPSAGAHIGHRHCLRRAPVRIPLLAAGRGLRAPPSLCR